MQHAYPEAASQFSPVKIDPLALRNRFIKSGANEDRTPAGRLTIALVKYHRNVAAGVAMTKSAYAAVAHDGLTFPRLPRNRPLPDRLPPP
ncbi:hypothetical protein A6V36_28275 [Paraburkholderia ginsengiterrae]|uniref:Uncharacterized protein n=1 Tax=Paraburkholderia ginsengiterrae TaxID=1462993 RepID=A0A1A9N7G9_9BURK|nr:hypothetical protein [Paraburkholderia ginsengiterrae]OAJ59236.1 hypothetical protein A6V36_28275 [Paraburkholderia ginsengiterrae]OAJ60178.1 hypothetical protein A6V37_25880 [Paraburkholderia ginsengiterrae]